MTTWHSLLTLRTAAKLAIQALTSAVSGAMERRQVCVLVVRDVGASASKLSRIRERVSFAFGRDMLASEFLLVDRVSLSLVVRSAIVVEVDQGIVPGWMHKAFRNVFAMDFDSNAMDAWEMVRIAYVLEYEAITGRRAVVRERFRRFVQGVLAAPRDRVYVFGTGPSLSRARARSFDDGYVVACNTIVRDAEMWAHLRPSFLVAGDAIYHFGHTEHARAFRLDLRARLTESRGRTLFVYPEMFDAVVRREMGDLEEQLAPLPFGGGIDVTKSLLDRPILPASSNVLNILLLPIGCTLSMRVFLWGFDGRAPTDSLFWANSTSHAYPELMPALLQEHPAFYHTMVPKGHETQYVKSVHGDELERNLAAAESRGFSFVMMHRSWTETLNRRFSDDGDGGDGR
jgi:hypothetical protein